MIYWTIISVSDNILYSNMVKTPLKLLTICLLTVMMTKILSSVFKFYFNSQYFLRIKSTEINLSWLSSCYTLCCESQPLADRFLWQVVVGGGGGRSLLLDFINLFVTVTLCTRNNFKTTVKNTPLAFINLALKTLPLVLTPLSIYNWFNL